MDKAFLTISKSLSGMMLGHALTLLRPWVAELSKNGQTTLSDRLQSLQENYQYVVDYYLSGEDDPYRSEVIHSLTREAYLLLDEVWLEKRLHESTSYEFQQMLALQANPSSPYVENKDDVAGPPQVFQFFWLCKTLEEFDLEVLYGYIHDEQMEEEALLGISGVTLNLLRCFSEKGILFLLKVCGETLPIPTLERAWTSLMLVLLHYDIRLRFFPQIIDAFSDLLTTETGSAFALSAMSAMIQTSGVEWASAAYNELQSDILNFVNTNDLKLKKNRNSRIMTISMEDLDDFGKSLTDDFQSLFHKRTLRMQQLRELHFDTDFALYRNMYTTSFFAEPFHWWLPFDTDYLRNEKELEVAGKLQDFFPYDMCESDRFALVTGVAGIMEHEIPDGLLPNNSDQDGQQMVCDMYTRQAYRFFVLNPWGIYNVFADFQQFPNSQLLKMLRPSAMDKIRVADQFFECHAYEVAEKLYAQYSEAVNTDDAWRNYGLCLQKRAAYPMAVEMYNRVNISRFTKKTEWVLRQKVWCLMQSELYDEACQVLDQLLARKPDDTAYLYEKGKCLEHLELYAEALDVYYKIEILQPRTMSVMRAIAWCSFICGQYEEAEANYKRLMDSDRTKMIDYLNYGHLLFVLGQRIEAFQHYKQALRACDNLKAFLQVFRPDRRILLEKGIPIPDIYLMEDQLIAN